MQAFLLHHLLDRTAARAPDRTAVIDGDRTLRYGELARDSARLASVLSALGVRPGDRVGLVGGKSLELVVGIYGILKAGGIYVPVDPHAPPQRNAGILSRCGVSTIVGSAAAAGDLLREPAAASAVRAAVVAGGSPAVDARCRIVPWDQIASVPEAAPVPISDTRPAYILHTSGSTGVPKGVTISHHASLSFVEMAAEYFAISREDRLAAHAPFHFDLSVFDLFTAARNGAAVVIVPEALGVFPSRLTRFIESAEITVWNSVASVIALLSERGDLASRPLDRVRVVVFSGDVLSVKHLRRARACMPNAAFYNVYGQTEANSSTCYRVRDVPADEHWRIPIGRPFPNFEVVVLDDRGEEIRRAGEIGELYVCASTVALGYWRDPERSAGAFVPHPTHPWPARAYRTGDLVTFDAQGDMVYVGRRDRQVKSRGYRIQIDEIELVLNGHAAVRQAVVVDVPDDVIGARLVAFVRRSGGVSDQDLTDACSRSLPPYMVPESIRFVEDFPRTPTGKIDRNALRAALCAST